jgi:hypothetical protein
MSRGSGFSASTVPSGFHEPHARSRLGLGLAGFRPRRQPRRRLGASLTRIGFGRRDIEAACGLLYCNPLQLIRIPMRQIVLDTETTGLNPRTGDRIIEVGCVEIVNRKLTGNNFHRYINPERDSDEAALAVHGILSEMGMVVTSAPFAVGAIGQALSSTGDPTGDGGAALAKSFPRFADDLGWWTNAARFQRAKTAPPY